MRAIMLDNQAIYDIATALRIAYQVTERDRLQCQYDHDHQVSLLAARLHKLSKRWSAAAKE